jgi:hypothetical protein
MIALISSALIESACTVPPTVTRIGNNVENDLIVDISILSKICTIESIIDNLESHVETFNSFVAAELATISSYVQTIDAQIITIESTTDNLTSFITGPLKSNINLIQPIDQSILSLVNVIDTRTSSIYSLDQDIASFVDLELATDQTIFSELMIIDSSISNLNLTCSGIDQILQTEQSILSMVNVIDTRTSNIYSLDQTIASYAQNIDHQVITIQSAVNTINNFVDTTINSKLDLILATDQTIASVAQVIDTRTANIYSLDQTLSSKVNSYSTLATSVESLVNIIDSKVGNFGCITSLAGQLAQLDQSILSTVMVLDTRTSNIQSTTDNIFSLDQTINSNISNILNLQQSTSSKVDVSIALDTTIASLLNNINSSITCSNIAQLVQIDQSILSTVNIIDTRTVAIQSNVNNIYNIDQSISSKIDLDASIDSTTQSTVSVINSKVNIIATNIATIAQVTNANASLVDALSNCCNSTANTTFTSFYNSVIADQAYDNIRISFQYGIPSISINTYTQGGGTVSNANSMAILSTATSTNSIAEIQTKNTIIYRSGHEAYAYFSVAFTGSFAATSSQFIGPIDYQNGFAVGFDGTTFGVTQRTSTINTFTPQSQFNGDTLNGTGASGFNYNPATLNMFRIAYGDGVSIVQFQILTSFGTWTTFHTIDYPNTSTAPYTYQPFLPITAHVENLSGTSQVTLQTASWNAGIVGEPNNSSYRYFQSNDMINTTTTAEVHLLTIRNKNVFNNQPNKIAIRLSGLGGISTPQPTTNSSCNLRLRKNATISSTSFIDVSSGSSVAEASSIGTYTAGTGTAVWGISSQNFGNGFGPYYFTNNPFRIMLYPGETLTVTTAGVAGSIVDMIAWEEQF